MARRFFEFESFRVDVSERRLWRGSELIPLTPKVFDVLLLLLENKGQTVEKERLIREVWADTYVEDGSINRCVSTLRRALGDDTSQQKLIKTLPKRGYRFTDKVEELVEENNSGSTVRPFLELPDDTHSSIASVRHGRRTIIWGLASILVIGLFITMAWTIGQKAKGSSDLSGLTAFERRELENGSSPTGQSRDEYVKGRTLWHQRSAEGLHESILHLERSISGDPNFSLAHAALADAYAFDVHKRNTAISHAEEATRLNPALGQPYATVGFVQMFWEWNLADANTSFRKAVELSPDYPTAHQWYAINLIALRQGGGALAEMKRALELEPNSLAINADLCQMYYFLQKYDEAITQCKKTLEADPGFLNAHAYLYEVYTARGMYDEAVAAFFQTETLKSDFALPVEHVEKLKLAYADGGIKAFWKTRIEFLERNPHPYELAKYSARLGEKEKATEWLRKSYSNRNFDFVFVLTDPVFKVLQNEPEFMELANALSF